MSTSAVALSPLPEFPLLQAGNTHASRTSIDSQVILLVLSIAPEKPGVNTKFTILRIVFPDTMHGSRYSFFSRREYPLPNWTHRETRLKVAEEISALAIT